MSDERAALMARPIKIVRVITRLNIGGPAIHALLLAREMRAFGYQTVLVAGSCEADEGDLSYLVKPDDRVCRVPELSRSISPARNLTAVWHLWRLMRKERPDVVHTHTAMAGFTGRTAAFLAGVPVTVHTFHGNSLRHYFGPATSAAFRLIERLLARITDRICAIAPQQVRELAHELRIAPEEKFRLVPLGLPLENFLDLQPPSPGRVFRAGWLGRLVPVKNAALLVEVIRETLARSSRIEFVAAGDGPERKLLDEAAANSHGRFRYLGWQGDVRRVIAGCDVLIQTSRNEGTPVALIQGMAAARPFVSTPAGGVVDMVSGDAEACTAAARWHSNGVLVDGGPEAFAEALIRLSENADELRRMGTAAREFASARYTKERLVRDLDELYREALAGRRR